MNAKDIEKAYSKLIARTRKYNENEAYVCGKNPEIYKEDKGKSPDNRIPVPLGKVTVDDMTGYAGRSISVQYRRVDAGDNNKTSEDEYNNLYTVIQDFNEDDLLLSEEYREVLSQEESYMLLWVSDSLGLDNGMLTPEYQILSMNQGIPFYDTSLKPELTSFIRFYDSGDDKYSVVYYPGNFETKKTGYCEGWTKKKDSDEWIRNPEDDATYPYMSVPLVVFRMSRKGGPIFEAEKPLIDAHDRAISKTQNELDRFNALLALFPGKVTPELAKKIEELKILDELDQYETKPEYLVKDLSSVETFYNNQIDRLERLYHKCVKVVDMTTAEFAAGDESGVARAFKLLGMEFKAAEIEIYFKKALYKRKELFDDVLRQSTLGLVPEDYTAVVTMKRNLPIDEKAKAELAVMLLGLGVTMETILKILPETVIEDVQDELRRIEEEKKERMANMPQLIQDTEGDDETEESGTDTE